MLRVKFFEHFIVLNNFWSSVNCEIWLHISNWWNISNVKNFPSQFEVFSPRGKKAIRRKDVELVFKEALHPLYIIVLTPDF